MKHRVFILATGIALLGLSGVAWGQGCWNCDSEGTMCLRDQMAGVEGCTGACVVWGQCGVAAGCFLAGTMVSVPGGAQAIEDFLPGDLVVSGYSANGQEITTVTDIIEVIASEYYEINGNIRVTGEHPFLVQGEWVDAKELKVGNSLDSTNGKEIRVESIDFVEKGVRAYNISVGWPNTFYAQDIRVHNKLRKIDP